MWSERALVSVSGEFVCDSHEDRVRFDADSRHRNDNLGTAMTSGHFPRELSEFWCPVRLKELMASSWSDWVDSKICGIERSN